MDDLLFTTESVFSWALPSLANLIHEWLGWLGHKRRISNNDIHSILGAFILKNNHPVQNLMLLKLWLLDIDEQKSIQDLLPTIVNFYPHLLHLKDMESNVHVSKTNIFKLEISWLGITLVKSSVKKHRILSLFGKTGQTMIYKLTNCSLCLVIGMHCGWNSFQIATICWSWRATFLNKVPKFCKVPIIWKVRVVFSTPYLYVDEFDYLWK